MGEFRPQDMPSMGDRRFLDLEPEEVRALRKGVNMGQWEFLVSHPAFRYFIARVKEDAERAKDQFFSGVQLPPGLEAGSAREAYFTGLVNGARHVLNLQRVVLAEIKERETPPPRPEKRVLEMEEDPFGAAAAPITGEPSA